MGVQRLQTYIHQNNLGKTVSLKNNSIRKIIVDGDSVSFYLYESSKLNRIFGGEYYDLYKYIYNYFFNLLQFKLELFVVFDGIPPAEKRNTIQERRKTKCSNGINLWKQMNTNTSDHETLVPITRPGFIRNVMKQVLNELRIPMCHSLAENDDYIVDLIKEKEYHGVLAKDTDFLIYDIKAYLPINYLIMIDGDLSARIISKNDLCRHFRLQEKFMPLLAFLAGNDITHGSKFISDKLYRLHNQSKPNVLKNIANMIVHNMDQVMQLITEDVEMLEGMLLCYKKYNSAYQSVSSFQLPEAYDVCFKSMAIDTEIAILLLKKTRCFTASFAGLELCMPKRLQIFRPNFYGVVTGNEDIMEHLWSFEDNQTIWIKSIVQSNHQFFGMAKTVDTFLACLNLPPNYLKDIKEEYYIPTLALYLMKVTIPELKVEYLTFLAYHVTHLKMIPKSALDAVCNDVLDKDSIVIMEIYLSCIQELLFFNQSFLFPIKYTNVSEMCQSRLFYAYANNLIKITKLEPHAEQMVNLISTRD